MSQVLMVGYNEAYLKSVCGRMPADSIIAIEEPDIIRKRNLVGREERLRCLARIVPASYQQATGFLHVGAAIHEESGVVAVVPALEYAVPAAAALAAKLGLPGATEAAANVLRDKAMLREVTARAGVRNPRSALIGSAAEIAAFAGGGPAVVKPANRQASVGVQLLDHTGPRQCAQAWAAVVAAGEYEQVPDRPMAWRYLVEERLHGPEYSVEALVRDGEIIFENLTAKRLIGGSRPVELAHIVPAPVPKATRAVFHEAMRGLIAAVQFDTGMLHAEWILTDGSPTLVECAGRCPGDRLADLIDLAYGTEIRLTLFDLLAGRTPTLPRQPRQVSVIRFLTARPGRVVRVDGLAAAQAIPGVHEVEVDLTPGDQANEWTSSWDRPGHTIVTAPDGAQAAELAERVAGMVEIVTE